MNVSMQINMKSTKFTCVFPKFNKVNNCRYIYTKSNRKITILYKKSLLFRNLNLILIII